MVEDEERLATKPQNHIQPATQKPRGFFRRWLPQIVILALIGAAVWFYFQKRQASVPGEHPAAAAAGKSGARRAGGDGRMDRAMPVVTATAKTADVNIFELGLGNVTPLATVTVSSRVDGQLMSVAFAEGQMVNAGDSLAQIDPRPYQAALLEAQGQLKKDQATLANSQRDLVRNQDLLAKKVITQQDYDTAAATVLQNEGAVLADQGTVDNAQLQVTYAHITAPVSGRVGLRQVDPGNIVHASDTTGLVVITQIQPITVVFTIPEDSLPEVLAASSIGEKLTVEAYDRAFQTKLAVGTLLSIDNQIDSTTGTVKLKASFPNEDNKLFPQQFVNVKLLVKVQHGKVIVPSAAIHDGAQSEKFVYVVKEDQTVKVQNVTPGTVQGENTAIENGLAAGDIVVIDGADKLREGAKVQVSGAANATAPGASPTQNGQAHHKRNS